MARPAKSPDARRDHRVIRVPVSREENERIAHAAELAGLPVAAFMRSAALAVPIRARPSRETAGVIRQLAAIGNNLNQLAREAHAGHAPVEGRIRSVLAEVEAAVRRLA